MKLNTEEFNTLLPADYIVRDMHDELYENIATRKEVTIIYGPRQVGKSSEILKIGKELYENEKNSDVFYYNLDQPSKDFENADYFINLIESSRTKPNNKCYIFIDEAQRFQNIGLFVKYIYDKKLNFKIVLTGSASLDIKEKIKEPLTGRKFEFHLSPLTLSEILRSKGFDPSRITGYFDELGKILDEYLIWGGYPEVVLEPIIERKREKLTEIANSYILRDMADLFDLDDLELINAVSVYLAENIGNLYSKHGTSKYLSYSRIEIAKVVKALEKTFVLKRVPAFSKNKTKELIHSKKVYFYDCGIRNALTGKLENLLLITDKGKLFENTVATHLMVKNGFDKLKFWRTQNQTEVDFIVQKSVDEIEAYEAKYFYEKNNFPRSLNSFIYSYREIVKDSAVITKQNYWKYLI